MFYFLPSFRYSKPPTRCLQAAPTPRRHHPTCTSLQLKSQNLNSISETHHAASFSDIITSCVVLRRVRVVFSLLHLNLPLLLFSFLLLFFNMQN